MTWGGTLGHARPNPCIYIRISYARMRMSMQLNIDTSKYVYTCKYEDEDVPIHIERPIYIYIGISSSSLCLHVHRYFDAPHAAPPSHSISIIHGFISLHIMRDIHIFGHTYTCIFAYCTKLQFRKDISGMLKGKIGINSMFNFVQHVKMIQHVEKTASYLTQHVENVKIP